MNKADFETLLICSTRYALGRSTYIVFDMSRLIAKHLHELSVQCVQVLHRDIKREIDRGNYGMQMDLECWAKTLLFIERRIDAIQSK